MISDGLYEACFLTSRYQCNEDDDCLYNIMPECKELDRGPFNEKLIKRIEEGERVDVTNMTDQDLMAIVRKLRRKGYVLGLDQEVIHRIVHHRNGKKEKVLELRRYLYIKAKG